MHSENIIHPNNRSRTNASCHLYAFRLHLGWAWICMRYWWAFPSDCTPTGLWDNVFFFYLQHLHCIPGSGPLSVSHYLMVFDIVCYPCFHGSYLAYASVVVMQLDWTARKLGPFVHSPRYRFICAWFLTWKCSWGLCDGPLWISRFGQSISTYFWDFRVGCARCPSREGVLYGSSSSLPKHVVVLHRSNPIWSELTFGPRMFTALGISLSYFGGAMRRCVSTFGMDLHWCALVSNQPLEPYRTSYFDYWPSFYCWSDGQTTAYFFAICHKHGRKTIWPLHICFSFSLGHVALGMCKSRNVNDPKAHSSSIRSGTIYAIVMLCWRI